MFFRRVFAKNGTSSSSSGEGGLPPSSMRNGNPPMVGPGGGSGVPIESPARYRRALNVENNHRVLSVLQLTPLWEYIIRNNELPVGLNMNELFREFLERLHDPEFQVRQHALRVLIDVIIVLRDETDAYFAPLLPPIIDNLGHPSPAVRKGALDVLKVYIAQTKLPETVMLEIMNYGMDRNPKDPLSSRYIVGVMLALPSLIQPAILTAKRTFILRAVINALGGKMVQITYQEIALKILLKIKNTIGSREFYECISVAYRRDFDLLCNVYGLPNPPKSPRRDPVLPPGEVAPIGSGELRKSWKPAVGPPVGPPQQPLSPKAQRWKSGSYSDISRPAGALYERASGLKSRIGSEEKLQHQHDYVLSKGPGGAPLLRRVSLEQIDDSKVIMETEIKINKESVTMRILEAENSHQPHDNSHSNSISEESDEDNANKRFGVVRVLTDSELEDSVTVRSIAGSQATSQHDTLLQTSDTEYNARRTPRRVRFGGEIVKMRTPDSDTFDLSDHDALSLSQSSSQSANLPLFSPTPTTTTMTTSERTTSSAGGPVPQRSSLKSTSTTSSSERSSATYSAPMMRRQYSQSADTERSSPPNTASMVSSEFSSRPRPSSAKSTVSTSFVSELNSGSDPEDNVCPSLVNSTAGDDVEANLRPTTPRPKSSHARAKPPKTPPAEPADSASDGQQQQQQQQQQHAPETPDNQSHPLQPTSSGSFVAPPVAPAALDASTILADKVEEVRQAIQGIESKIQNVVVLQKADSADAAQEKAPASAPHKLESNLSLEVLMKTNAANENAANLERDPSQAEHNEKDYTKELNIEIPREEKLQNVPPRSPGQQEKPAKPIPRIVRSGIPRLNTMPSPKTMRKAHEASKSPSSKVRTGGATKSQLTPQPADGRGRARVRSRSATSATMRRSVYISPSSLSPKPHSGIEIIHNLLRSPSTSPHRSRRKSSAASDLVPNASATSDRNNNNIDSSNEPGRGAEVGHTDKCVNVHEEDIFDVFGKTIATQTSVDELEVEQFVPYSRTPSRNATRIEMSDSSKRAADEAAFPERKGMMPAREQEHSPGGASGPPSPNSRQEAKIVNSWEDLGIVDQLTLYLLKSADWRMRSQGFCNIEEALKSTDNLAKVQPYLESLLRTLLSSERNSDVIDDKVRMLVNLVSRLPLENLEDRVGQIMTGLCRQGGPGSNTVAKSLMQRLPTAAIVQRLLSDDFLHARSSKFRENALQMVLFALMTFPSTYFDIKTLISRATEAAMDRKKRVRHAALDVLAVLGQISSPKLVLDVVCLAVGTRPEGNHLITAVKARLARKQLPFIGPDGSVEYAVKIPSSRSSTVIMFGADVDWIEAGSGSASPTFHRPGRHKYPSFQVENTLMDEMRTKPSFKVFDESKPPADSSRPIPSGWSSKIPVSYSDGVTQPIPANASRQLYGNVRSSRSYPELMDNKLSALADGKSMARRPDRQVPSGIPQISNGSKLIRQPTAGSRFPEMDPRAGESATRAARNSNPYEMRTPRMRGKLHSRNSDGFMSDTIASANKQVHSDIRPSTDPVVENEGFRQSRSGMRFYNPNQMDNSSKHQGSAHALKRNGDLQQTVTPGKGYNNQPGPDETNNRSNSATHGERYFSHSITGGTGSSPGTAPSTPLRARFLGEDQPAGPVINQESYTIHRDENYDSEQDERSSNDSTSTRIISNSIFNFRERDRERVTVDDRSSRAPSLTSASRPQSVSSRQHFDGHHSRASSNVSLNNASLRNQPASETSSLKSNRPPKNTAPSVDDAGEWYGERGAATPMHSETDGISSNQVQYESDYDDDDDDDDGDAGGVRGREKDDRPQSRPHQSTPKRYPTPSPHPLQGSYSTEDLSSRHAFQQQQQQPADEEEEIEEEIEMTLPRSRVQSASLGNLRHLADREERELEASLAASHVVPKKKKPFLVRRSSKVAPAKDAGSGVKAKNKLNEVIFQKTLRRFDKPKDALSNCLAHLESPNWEQNISGLQFFVRLIRHHPEVIDTQIHLLSVALAKQVRNLRSQVARAACQASGEFFSTHRRCIEGESEDIATHLLHRTADTNKFLRADATQALESMCENVSIQKVVHIIAFKGATHQNAVVRTTAAKLLDRIVQKNGSEKVFALPKETRDKLILTGAHLLLEGSLETRNFTKSMFRQLSDHPNYSKVLLEVIPSRTYRNIEKALNSIRQMP